MNGCHMYMEHLGEQQTGKPYKMMKAGQLSDEGRTVMTMSEDWPNTSQRWPNRLSKDALPKGSWLTLSEDEQGVYNHRNETQSI